jgi:hypothetical protein
MLRSVREGGSPCQCLMLLVRSAACRRVRLVSDLPDEYQPPVEDFPPPLVETPPPETRKEKRMREKKQKPLATH